MTTIEYGSDVNLEELRGQLAGRVALVLMVVSSVACGYWLAYARHWGDTLTQWVRAFEYEGLMALFFVRDNSPGLGLSIVQRIAEKLGGQVGVDSAGAGQGCTFWFVLP